SLDLPSHTYRALSDAKSPDYQAGLETAFTAALAAAAGFDVVSGPGMLEFESVQSLEKLVLDNEVCLLAKRIARGFARDSDSVGVIREVVLQKRGNFLAHRHTRETYRHEIHLPKVWDVASRARGTRDLLKWAYEEVERILREHEPPVLEGDRLERLDEVLSRLYGRVGQSPPRV
ncbi:MAG: trimethylamine methyltransferase family protein, partial [Thermofilaceae archaeon]